MQFDDLINSPAEWMRATLTGTDIVVSSRIRLARNLHEVTFPGWAKRHENQESLQLLLPHVSSLPEMEQAFSAELGGLTAIKKQVLVERHLISREHAARGDGSAVVMNATQTICIMINEEDHLRMQAIQPGLALTEAFSLLSNVDSTLEDPLEFAFDSRLGYLTACPTNVGTGLRASAMLHLPALVLRDQINRVIKAVNKIGLAVRGLYGEGTEALANLFQISNQKTLGEPEEKILAQMNRVVSEIVKHEQNSREHLFKEKGTFLLDKIGRAYAALRYAYLMPSKEALNLLSMIRLGCDLGFFPVDRREIIDSLLIEIQPAHLQLQANKRLRMAERDELRSEIMRTRLKSLPEPDISNLGHGGSDSETSL